MEIAKETDLRKEIRKKEKEIEGEKETVKDREREREKHFACVCSESLLMNVVSVLQSISNAQTMSKARFYFCQTWRFKWKKKLLNNQINEEFVFLPIKIISHRNNFVFKSDEMSSS